MEHWHTHLLQYALTTVTVFVDYIKCLYFFICILQYTYEIKQATQVKP